MGAHVLFWRKYICIILICYACTTAVIFSQDQSGVKRPEIFAPFISNSLTVDGDASDWAAIKALGEGVTFYPGDGAEGTSAENLGTTIRKVVDGKEDLCCSAWVAHDGTYLYVLAEEISVINWIWIHF